MLLKKRFFIRICLLNIFFIIYFVFGFDYVILIEELDFVLVIKFWGFFGICELGYVLVVILFEIVFVLVLFTVKILKRYFVLGMRLGKDFLSWFLGVFIGLNCMLFVIVIIC